jgi:hypothetical protein
MNLGITLAPRPSHSTSPLGGSSNTAMSPPGESRSYVGALRKGRSPSLEETRVVVGRLTEDDAALYVAGAEKLQRIEDRLKFVCVLTDNA